MQKCTRCGGELHEGNKFCGVCGHPADAAQPAAALPEGAARPAEHKPAEHRPAPQGYTPYAPYSPYRPAGGPGPYGLTGGGMHPMPVRKKTGYGLMQFFLAMILVFFLLPTLVSLGNDGLNRYELFGFGVFGQINTFSQLYRAGNDSLVNFLIMAGTILMILCVVMTAVLTVMQMVYLNRVKAGGKEASRRVLRRLNLMTGIPMAVILLITGQYTTFTYVCALLCFLLVLLASMRPNFLPALLSRKEDPDANSAAVLLLIAAAIVALMFAPLYTVRTLYSTSGSRLIAKNYFYILCNLDFTGDGLTVAMLNIAPVLALLCGLALFVIHYFTVLLGKKTRHGLNYILLGVVLLLSLLTGAAVLLIKRDALAQLADYSYTLSFMYYLVLALCVTGIVIRVIQNAVDNKETKKEKQLKDANP